MGLTVRVIVNDMGSTNISASNIRNISADNPVFTVDNEEIVYIFVVPHLIKAVRNNFRQDTMYFDEKWTSWDYICQFYNCDKQLSNRLAPKLNDGHINPSNMEKMRVYLIVQVLNATVAAALTTYVALPRLPVQATATIEFIERFDRTFDI